MFETWFVWIFHIGQCCCTPGEPVPEVTWYKSGTPFKPKKDDTKIKVQHDEKQDLHILIILDATESDAGDYTVIAENKYGSFKFTVTVLVGKPEGAEIVMKTVQSKRTVVEETLVDGKVVERVVKEDTTEEAPETVELKPEEVKPKEVVTELVSAEIKPEVTTEAKMEVEETKSVSSTQDIGMTETLVLERTEDVTSTETKTSETSQATVLTAEPSEDQVTMKVTEVKEEVKKVAVKKAKPTESEESSSSSSSSEESSSESSSEEEEGKPPKFVQPPEPVFVDVGETIQLSCKVSGWQLQASLLSTFGRCSPFDFILV